jgi:hypothetical protein
MDAGIRKYTNCLRFNEECRQRITVQHTIPVQTVGAKSVTRVSYVIQTAGQISQDLFLTQFKSAYTRPIDRRAILRHIKTTKGLCSS